MLRKNHIKMSIVFSHQSGRFVFLLMFCSLSVLRSHGQSSQGNSIVLDSGTHHLRNGAEREWATFPEVVSEKKLTLLFNYNGDRKAATLSLEQFDVKQEWRVLLNDTDIGGLVQDEKYMITYLSIPATLLAIGQNSLLIKAADDVPDDIKVGRVALHLLPVKEILSESVIEISVIENGTGRTVPSRVTIVNNRTALQPIDATSSGRLAIRTGYVYSSDGKTSISLPHGNYTLYAGRGFEYSIDSVNVELKAGDRITHTFQIKREVETTGWVSSDTHVHTFTHSGHGDATIHERAITLAGEGIELPVITDHNKNIDITAAANESDVSAYFTPVTGNELTTKVGHFNIFRTNPKHEAISASGESWNDISTNVGGKENSQAIILNHARDIHNGFRPFDPSHHISSAGVSTLNWAFPANAMEVINSGSQQTNIMTLFQDWFGMMNHGQFLTPVGSSDSHDVSRFTVGQGRTYIKVPDTNVSNIRIDDAISSFLAGRVLVSLGLLTKMSIGGSFGPGDVYTAGGDADVSIEVHGPAWAHAQRVSLYLNGVKVKEEKITRSDVPGQKWKGTWKVSFPSHDVFLVAIAEGNGSALPFWPIAEPYQPMSIEWSPSLMGSTGALWIDRDGDGNRSSAYDYAVSIVQRSDNDVRKIIKTLSNYHESVAVQAAVILWKNGINLNTEEIRQDLAKSSKGVRDGFKRAIEEIKLIK